MLQVISFKLMLFFFYGPNVKEAVQKKTASFLKANPAGLVESFDLAEEGQWEQFSQMALARSFFEEKKFLAVWDSFAIAETAAKLATFLEEQGRDLKKNAEVIFQERQTEEELKKKNKNLWAVLKSKADEMESCQERQGAKLQRWIEEKFQSAGLTLTPAAANKLMLAASSSPGRLPGEIDKLIAYKKYQGPLRDEAAAIRVGEGEVDLLVKFDLTLNNFALADAVANQDQRKSIELLHHHLEQGEDPYAILGLLIYQFRNLLKIKALVKEAVPYASLASVTKLHPFVVKKTYEQARKFELDDLRKIFRSLLELEVKFKDGQIDLPYGLTQVLLKI